MKQELDQVLKLFGVGMSITSPVKNTAGSVNVTFTIETTKGMYVVQRLAPMFSEASILQGLKVHIWLRSRGLVTPEYCATSDGRVSVRYGGYIWRVSPYIVHDPGLPKTPARIVSAAHTLGQFHELMKDYPLDLPEALPGFHNTPQIIDHLVATIEHYTQHPLYNHMTELAEVITTEIPGLFLKPNINTTIIHGDPKYDNFIFKADKVTAFMDLDTVMRGSELLDLGDAFRSWCRTEGNQFDYPLFASALSAYKHVHQLVYTEADVLRSVGLITLELAARYLIDACEEKYFQWDKECYSSLTEQNISLAERYVRYYQSIATHL